MCVSSSSPSVHLCGVTRGEHETYPHPLLFLTDNKLLLLLLSESSFFLRAHCKRTTHCVVVKVATLYVTIKIKKKWRRKNMSNPHPSDVARPCVACCCELLSVRIESGCCCSALRVVTRALVSSSFSLSPFSSCLLFKKTRTS